MLNDINFEIVYTSGEHEPVDFFFDSLIESVSFDLGLGFFSSSAIKVIAPGFAYFIANGGKMRVIINDVLSEEDKMAISKGYNIDKNSIEEKLILKFDYLYENLTSEGVHFYNCLSYLIACNRIEFIATIPSNSKGGMVHHKFGIFRDCKGNKVAFSGSSNFSETAFYDNSETLSCYTSWTDSIYIQQYVNHYEEFFEKIWTNKFKPIEIIPIERIKTRISEHSKTKNIQDLINENKSIYKKGKHRTYELSKSLLEKIAMLEIEPKFPGTPREYQIDAYHKWVTNNHHGVFAMATGTGKTLTSLYCILEDFKKTGIYNVIITVPTKTLAIQWTQQVNNFKFQNIVTTTLSNNWTNDFARINKRRLLNRNDNFFIITTYATFNKSKFFSLYKDFKNKGTVTLIADEAHTLGSKTSLLHLPLEIGKKIGLSATPERIYDDLGSNQLYDFFKSYPPCYTYNYSMKKAIDNEVLCRYYYYPIVVQLDNDELEIYNDLSRQLAMHFDAGKGKYKESANFLLMERKRVIHKARNKKLALKDILKTLKIADKKLQYTFVYVPEGYEPDYSIMDDYNIDESDIHIIDEYSQILNSFGYKTHQFLGGGSNSQNILRQFEQGKLDILLAMKCLDEGVDIPRTETAIFCSSTGNPRQFIQRRGRILRNHDDKKYAKIYDLVVVPPLENLLDIDLKGIKSFELNIFLSELRRVVSFLALSENWDDILNGTIGDLCTKLKIDIYKLLNDFNSQEEMCKDK